MSSSSQITSSNLSSDFVIIGSRFTTGVLARSFASLGHLRHQILRLPQSEREPEEGVAYLGNGECMENARLIFGKILTHTFWTVSALNFQKLRLLLNQSGLLAKASTGVWYASNPKEEALLHESAKLESQARFFSGQKATGKEPERGMTETALVFSLPRLTDFLDKERSEKGLDAAIEVEAVTSLKRLGSFDYELTYLHNQKEQSIRTPCVLVASDAVGPQLLSVSDRWLPVTLSSFSYGKKKAPDIALGLFHSGVDFAVRSQGDRYRLGSFRNLYEDRAFGIQTQPDEKTRLAVSRFFGKLDWIDCDETPRPFVSVEGISCDGLPIVGDFSENPGVYCLGAFSGRSCNFIFEMADLLAEAILKGRSAQSLEPFSTRRFVT